MLRLFLAAAVLALTICLSARPPRSPPGLVQRLAQDLLSQGGEPEAVEGLVAAYFKTRA